MIGSIVAGRFKIEKKAGSGGMGTVYRAHDLVDGSKVALKILASEEIRDAERFAQEAAILATLSHPAIVRYIAHGVTRDQHFMAMEWLDGESLDVRADKEPLSLFEVLGVLRRTTQALTFAHDREIIHRDIKPENLYLPGGRIEALKLLDFGVARLAQAKRKLTQTGVFLGTPAYVAPEVVMGSRAVDRRIDFYSLGCVAYRCLTGRTPFESDDVGALLTKIMLEEAPSVKKLAPTVPDAMAALVARLLEKDPSKRPADGAELLAAIEKLEDLPDVRPEYRRRRASVSLTLSEKRIACLVMAGPPDGARLQLASARSDVTAVVVERAGAAPELSALEAEIVGSFGAVVHSFPDRSYIVRMPPLGKATDLATRAAQAALVTRRHTPDRPIVVVSGQVSVDDDSVGLGHMIDVAAEMMGDTPVGRIRLHDMVAVLADARFQLAREGTRVFLESDPTVTEGRGKLLGRATAFVGRSRELGGLTGMLTAGLDDGSAQAAVVVGPSGIGKSRLLEEFLAAAQRQAPALKVMYTGADSLAAGSPFALLARLLRRHAGICDGEPLEESRRKLQACYAPESGADAAKRLAFLGELCRISFPDSQSEALRAARANPQLMGDLMRRAFEDWLKAECDEQPVLLVLDDLHWGDAGTVAFVDAALRTLRDSTLLVLALGRPELRDTFPDLWAHCRPAQIDLGPLSKKAAERLVKEALGAQATPAAVAAIVARADGNPFYIEELVRAAREGRADSLPDSILGMVHARLDAEGDVAKQILRAASIFGEQFSRRGLAALLGGEAELPHLSEWVDRLVVRELVAVHARGQGSEGELSFSHALIRDAAYATLTEEDSVLGHQLAGDYLEQVACPDAMVLAQHFRRGNQPVRAVRWYREAAEQALRASDLPSAIGRAQMGLATIATLDPARRAEVASDAVGALRLTQAEAHLWRAEFSQAVARGTEATGALRPGSALWFRGLAQTVVGVAKQGKAEELAVLARDALNTECDADAGSAQVICMAWAATFLLVADRRREADLMLVRMGEIVKGLDDPDAQALALLHQAQAARASVLGDQAACLTSLEAALAAFDMAGDVRNVSTVRSNIGFVVAELGVWERAESVLRDALADAQRMGLAELEAVVQHNLGRVLAIRGDLTAGEMLERQAIDSFARQGEPRLEGLARTYLAEIRLLAGSPTDAEALANEAIEVLKSSPAARVQALAVRAAAALALSRTQDALAIAQKANQELDTLGSIEEGEAAVRLVYAECLAAAGRQPEATAVIDLACKRLRERADGIADTDLRKRFLSDVPVHARALQLARAWTVELELPPRAPMRPAGDKDAPPVAPAAGVGDAAGAASAGEPEVTVRALVVGGGLGVVLAAANTYAGLKTGYIDGGSITATLLGSALLGAIGRRAASARELNVVQTVASSAAVMSFAAGVSAPIPALVMAGHAVPGGTLLVWGLALAGLGIALGAWLRARLIESEALPFPTGQATAEVVRAVAAGQGAGRGRLVSLLVALGVAGALSWLRDGPLHLIPGAWMPDLAIGALAAGTLTVGLAASPLLLATGILVGPRIAFSMVLGAALAWGLFAPAALRAGLAPEPGYAALVPILLWPGLALLVGSALTTLALAAPAIARSLGDLALALRRARVETPDAASSPTAGSLASGGDEDGSRRPAPPAGAGRSRARAGVVVVAVAIVAAVLAVGVIGAVVFGLSPLVLLALLPIAVLLAAASARAAGETDQAPVGQVGSVVQLGVGGAGVVPALAAGGLVSGIATQTAQTLWALKAGQRLGARPRAQLLAQVVGAAIGAAVVVPVFALVRAAYPLGSERMPAPAALAWKATAEAAQGDAPFARPLILEVTALAAIAGILLTLLERRGLRWLPSATAMGAAFVLPAFLSMTILVGALLFAAVARARPVWSDTHGASLAAGGIAGESLLGLALAAWAVLGG